MVIVFPYGTCAICGDGLPCGSKPSAPRVICDTPSCISAHRAFAARRGNSRRKRLNRQATSRLCPQCGRDLPLTVEHWYVDKRNPDGSIAAFHKWCRECKRWYQTIGRWVRLELAEAGRLTRAMARHDVLRRLVAEEPDLLERAVARRAAASAAYRKAHPEIAHAQSARAWQRVKADPEKLRRTRENRRIARRLRRERQGKPLVSRPREEAERDEQRAGVRMPAVPAKPLADVLERKMARLLHEASYGGDVGVSRETIAESWGTSERSIRAWRNGERQVMQFNVADALLVATDMLAIDVWDDPEVVALWP